MKNRKTIIVGFILVACMLVGVGYAVVTNTLDIGGTSHISNEEAQEEFNEDVFFAGVVISGNVYQNTTELGASAPEGYTAHITTADPDKASFTVTGAKSKDESETIVFRVTNTGDLNAKLKMASHSNSNETYFDVKYYVGDSVTPIDLTAGTEIADLAAGTTVDIKVIVTVKQTPNSYQSLTTTFEFNAVSGE